MRLSATLRPRLLVLSALLFAAGSAGALSSYVPELSTWDPWIQLFGRGDQAVAVRKMESLLHVYDLVLEHAQVDADAQRLIDREVAELRDFDLEHFYKLLPEERSGGRELRLRGAVEGDAYRVRRARPDEAFSVGISGPRSALGDASQRVRVRPPRKDAKESSFLLSMSLGAGIGRVDWNDMVEALSAFLRRALDSEATKQATSPRNIEKLHPELAPEDLAVMTPLFRAYPELSLALSQMGRIDDVLGADARPGVRHVQLRMQGLTERLSRSHPDLAKYMKKLGRVGRFSFTWLDPRGRSLAKASIDSETLQIGLECFVKNGQLLPWSSRNIYEDEPLIWERDTPYTSRIIVDGRVELMGLLATFNGFSIDVEFKPAQSQAQLTARACKLPKTLTVQGTVFGFMPLGLVNALIPGDVHSLTLDFFRVALEGNGGRGVLIDTRVGSSAPGGDGVVELQVELEALDNPLVKMAMTTVNHKVIAPPKVDADMRKFAADLERGLRGDLEAYKRQVGL